MSSTTGPAAFLAGLVIAVISSPVGLSGAVFLLPVQLSGRPCGAVPAKTEAAGNAVATTKEATTRVTSLSIEPHFVNDGVLRLAVAGDVDLSTCELLGAAIRDVVAAGHVAELVVDLDRVTFLDSTGIAVLVDGHNLAVAHGVAYLVINPSDMVHTVLSITGILPVLTEEP